MNNTKENNETNNKRKKFLKLQKLHDFLINNSKIKNGDSETEKEEDNNIYLKYLKNPNIIFQSKGDLNNNNLKLLFKELNDDIDNGNNIVFPFLNICKNLVKAYIESDLDEKGEKQNEKGETPNEKGEESNKKSSNQIISIYKQVFKKLKYNCFIHKNVLMDIYEYFSNLYDKVHEIKDDDKLMRKFCKMVNLFEIFYENERNDNMSTICSLGGNIKISFNNKIKLSKGYQIFFNINILSLHLNDLIKSLNLIKINDIEEKYETLLNNISNQTLKSINFNVSSKAIDIQFKTEKREMKITLNVELDEIQEIYFFQDFYGQISSIDVTINNGNNKEKYKFLPISIRNGDSIYYYKKSKDENNLEKNNLMPKIIICDKNLVNINYLNYNDKNFDIIDYFGGVIQFLPFYHICNTLNGRNLYKISVDVNKIQESNDESANKTEDNSYSLIKEYISNLVDFITKVIIKKLIETNKELKYFKKYAIFIFHLILNLDLELNLVYDTDKEIKKEKELEKKAKKKNILPYIELLRMIYYTQKNIFAFDTKSELNDLIMFDDIKDEVDLSAFKYPKKSINQLYKQYMKKLFVFNNFWSKKNVFYNIQKTKEIKYKQINYYTKNFQLPYDYPILEVKKYFPKFSKLRDGIFAGIDNNILNYDFELNIRDKAKEVISILTKTTNNSYINEKNEKCCLVKNTHHIRGALYFQKNNKNNNNKDFELMFHPQLKENEKCNKNIYNTENEKKKRNNSRDSLCYGSVFECPVKELDRNIIIKSKDILFLLYRNYFHRISAIEIFTKYNKSYYFNFYNYFDNNNIKKNPILNEFRISGLFKEIKTKKEKLGLYNTKYESYLFPLFKDDINIWDKKIKYLSNYDLIILINIFSNRSFRDVYQYPIFPTLYNPIKLKRKMEEQIGFQELTDICKDRKMTIIKNYDDKENDDGEEKYLFNIHYSNPAFLFNYLLRVLPYSFLAIEFQGDDFDNPNRLFFSIDKTLKGTLTIKSDLREMIPEFFYMIELFYNKNNILFEKLYDGSKIDYVEINENDYSIPKTIKEKKEDFANFLFEMRNILEKEKDINKWIDIIFGIKQKYSIYDHRQYKNYDSYSEIAFKNDLSKINSFYAMQYADFGLLPYQLFNKDFPSKNYKNSYKSGLNNLNLELFEEEHINEINSPFVCSICKGSNLLNNNYIQIIDEKEQINNLDYFDFPNKYWQKLNIYLLNKYIFTIIFDLFDKNINKQSKRSGLFNYYFVGDIFGTLFIYSLLKAKKDKNEEDEDYIELEAPFDIENEELTKILTKKIIYNNVKLKRIKIPITKNNKTIFEFEIKLVKTLYNHSKEIKYIDFNPRLNLLLSYSLDNFINIYMFPKLKLINVIDTTLFKEENDINHFDKVVLISYPFPMIVCYNIEYIYLLSINGEIIKNEKLEENHIIFFYIDKNLGLTEDKVQIIDSKGIHYFNLVKE